jgi:hypothetical protein
MQSRVRAPIQAALELWEEHRKREEDVLLSLIEGVLQEHRGLLLSLRFIVDSPPDGYSHTNVKVEIEVGLPRVINGELQPRGLFTMEELGKFTEWEVRRLYGNLGELMKVLSVLQRGTAHWRTQTFRVRERED